MCHQLNQLFTADPLCLRRPTVLFSSNSPELYSASLDALPVFENAFIVEDTAFEAALDKPDEDNELFHASPQPCNQFDPELAAAEFAFCGHGGSFDGKTIGSGGFGICCAVIMLHASCIAEVVMSINLPGTLITKFVKSGIIAMQFGTRLSGNGMPGTPIMLAICLNKPIIVLSI